MIIADDNNFEDSEDSEDKDSEDSDADSDLDGDRVREVSRNNRRKFEMSPASSNTHCHGFDDVDIKTMESFLKGNIRSKQRYRRFFSAI